MEANLPAPVNGYHQGISLSADEVDRATYRRRKSVLGQLPHAGISAHVWRPKPVWALQLGVGLGVVLLEAMCNSCAQGGAHHEKHSRSAKHGRKNAAG